MGTPIPTAGRQRRDIPELVEGVRSQMEDALTVRPRSRSTEEQAGGPLVERTSHHGSDGSPRDTSSSEAAFSDPPHLDSSMALSTDEVRYIARLARLRFSEDDEQRLAQEMGKVLDYMDTLNELDTSGVPPMSHVLDLYNVQRKDEEASRISHDDALSNAPDADGDYFRVPKVID